MRNHKKPEVFDAAANVAKASVGTVATVGTLGGLTPVTTAAVLAVPVAAAVFAVGWGVQAIWNALSD